MEPQIGRRRRDRRQEIGERRVDKPERDYCNNCWETYQPAMDINPILPKKIFLDGLRMGRSALISWR